MKTDMLLKSLVKFFQIALVYIFQLIKHVLPIDCSLLVFTCRLNHPYLFICTSFVLFLGDPAWMGECWSCWGYCSMELPPDASNLEG